MKHVTLLGAIAGDVIGSIYEFHPTKDYNFPLLVPQMEITDDSIMTIAVADWILHSKSLSHDELIGRLRYWGHKYRYPMGAYGSGFAAWLDNPNPKPYGSFGNGSAMRVSACGFAFDSIEQTMNMAKRSAEVTHNHLEGIIGAWATSVAIYLARTGHTKEQIRAQISHDFGYDLNHTCDEIRPGYSFQGSCQETVPQALIAFFDSHSYEDAIRLTVSLGGDADTMGAITGAVAAAFYKEIPDAIYDFVMARIPSDLKKIVLEFEEKYGGQEIPRGRCGVTPENITHLSPNEIFVFGSNLAGAHMGGAAAAAVRFFGAKMGVGVGIQGHSYAIPTMQGPVSTIKPYVDQFIDFAKHNPHQHFLVTRIGCGIAGFSPWDIAPLFAKAISMPNVSLPQDFIDVIQSLK